MVNLVNIKKQDNILTCNYYTECNIEDQGYIEYDIIRHEILNVEYSEADKIYNIAFGCGKAKRALERVIENGNYPESYCYMWY